MTADILVAGSSGYIGSALVEHLRKTGREVDTLDLVGEPKFRMDYCKIAPSILRQYPTVILLAGHSNVKAAVADPLGAFHNNLVGPVVLANMLTAEQRFIYASSASIYSLDLAQDWRAYQNMYDLSKFCADAAVMMIRPDNTHALRFGTVNGPSPNIRLDLMINRMTWSAVTRRLIEMSNPAVDRPILSMRDLCTAFERILDGVVPAGVHNLCSLNTTVYEVARKIGLRWEIEPMFMPPTGGYSFRMKPAPWIDWMTDNVNDIVDQLIKRHGEQWGKAA